MYENMEKQIVEALRNGTPPERGVNLYSVGNEKLIEGVKKFHLSGIGDRGIIRFVNGSWGAGKTHFFRQLREVGYENGCLVSSIELNVNSAALNKFQSVFKEIIHQITTPSHYAEHATPYFGTAVRESLAWLATGNHQVEDKISSEQYAKATESLMRDHSIDIDFRKMIQHYWNSFLPNAPASAVVEQTRGEILQWFSGEGTAGAFRKRFGVNKMITKENAKLMFGSLARFVRLSGYKGLLILFDEAEQSYSVMRKSALKDAQNNLLSLINNIGSQPGLFLIYATTPDFYNDPKHGIIAYGALSSRIGQPPAHPPQALDIVWNLDAVKTELKDYQEAARKIRAVYASAYPETELALPDGKAVTEKVAELYRRHSPHANIRFWRLLVKTLITDFEDHWQGKPRTTEKLYDDVMDRLKEE